MNRIHALSLPLASILILPHIRAYVSQAVSSFRFAHHSRKYFLFFPVICYKPRPIYLSWFDHSNHSDESTNHGNFHYISLSSFRLLPLSSSALHVFFEHSQSVSCLKVRDHFEVHAKEQETLEKYNLFSVANFTDETRK